MCDSPDALAAMKSTSGGMVVVSIEVKTMTSVATIDAANRTRDLHDSLIIILLVLVKTRIQTSFFVKLFQTLGIEPSVYTMLLLLILSPSYIYTPWQKGVAQSIPVLSFSLNYISLTKLFIHIYI